MGIAEPTDFHSPVNQMLQKLIHTNLLYLALVLCVASYLMLRAIGPANPMSLIISACALVAVILACSVNGTGESVKLS